MLPQSTFATQSSRAYANDLDRAILFDAPLSELSYSAQITASHAGEWFYEAGQGKGASFVSPLTEDTLLYRVGGVLLVTTSNGVPVAVCGSEGIAEKCAYIPYSLGDSLSVSGLQSKVNDKPRKPTNVKELAAFINSESSEYKKIMKDVITYTTKNLAYVSSTGTYFRKHSGILMLSVGIMYGTDMQSLFRLAVVRDTNHHVIFASASIKEACDYAKCLASLMLGTQAEHLDQLDKIG